MLKPSLLLSRSHLRDALLLICILFARFDTTSFSVGLGLFFLGLGWRLWAKGMLRRNREVTNRGPYALCRHPFYLASLILDLSLPIMAGVPLIAILYVPIFFLIYVPTIRREESNLAQWFGDTYREYQSHTPMILPARFPKSFRQIAANWSMRFIYKEREASRTLQLLALPLLIVWASEIKEGWWEIFESETLLMLSIALLLHYSGRIIYLRREKKQKISLVAPARIAGVGALMLVFFFLTVELRLSTQQELQQQARITGAIPVETEGEFHQRVASTANDLLIVSDDVIECATESAGKYSIVNVFWSDFEVFFLIRS